MQGITPICLLSSLLLSLLIMNGSQAADNPQVSFPVRVINMKAGEAQSTVVPPGLKNQCPKGRVLVSNDLVRPPKVGTVIGRNLDSQTAPDVKSTFPSAPDSNLYYFGTNDHDIVVLKNGDVLLIWGVHSKAPLNPKPGWFDYTYKGNWGPGARRGMMVWRSVDCGNTFQYLSEIDTATVGNKTCGNPQPAGSSTPAGTATQPNFANGGVDGQLVAVDPKNDDVYVMMQCVGFKQDTSKSGYQLSTERVNRTYVMRSKNKGQSWQTLGFLPSRAWRYAIVPIQGGKKLVFARSNSISIATRKLNGTYQFPTTEQPAPTTSGWGSDFNANPNIKPAKIVGANIWAHTVISRIPGSYKRILLAFPSKLPGSNNTSTFGYRLYEYDIDTNQFVTLPAVYPSLHTVDGFTLHLNIVDPKTGPLLMYWYDMNAATKKAVMRGRMVYGSTNYSADFNIAMDNLKNKHTFNLIAGTGYWYGDYKTAGGFAPQGIIPSNKIKYQFYPMWVEPDHTTRFSEVIVKKSLTVLRPIPRIRTIYYPKPKFGPPPVEMRVRKFTRAEEESLGYEYDKPRVTKKLNLNKNRLNLKKLKPTQQLKPVKTQ